MGRENFEIETNIIYSIFLEHYGKESHVDYLKEANGDIMYFESYENALRVAKRMALGLTEDDAVNICKHVLTSGVIPNERVY